MRIIKIVHDRQWLTLVALLIVQITTISSNFADEVRFAVIGDFGTGSRAQADVAEMVQSQNVQFVATVGDNIYSAANDGSAWNALDNKLGKYYQTFIHPYLGVYGSGAPDGVNHFFPLLGNHDYGDGGPADIPLLECIPDGGLRSCSQNQGAWYNYFNLPGNERYYSVKRGDVEVFLFSDYYKDPDWDYNFDRNGVVQWLKNGLMNSTSRWQVVLLHFPPYFSSAGGGNANRQLDYAQWGADVVIAGHNHYYERLEVDGIPYFVNGAGGASLGRPGPPIATSRKQVFDDYGAMIVQANPQTLTLEYRTRDGALRDSLTLGSPKPPEPQPPTQVDYSWNNVPIGGGGYITGIDIHPQNPDIVYARTDVGGAYRWQPASDSWLPLNESIRFDDRNLWGIESLAVDPNDTNTVYVAAGDRPDLCACDILKSTDRGQSWQPSNATGIRIGGNNLGRWSGERLAVDPNNAQIVYYASRFDGLWRSQAASSPGSWQRMANSVFTTSNPPAGNSRVRGTLSFIAIDPRATNNDRSQVIYVGDHEQGIYVSRNAGASWQLISRSP